MILDHIYEPVFVKKHNDVNYGFRKNRDTHQAILRLQTEAQNTQWCIEGDIKGAYDNVNHDILIKILSEKITDKKFLQFIESGLKSGSIH
jgi:retron-type reverse transcriptase